jgi:hypothetical protein
MYDLAMANAKPGKCCKCNGTGLYRWGAMVNGKATKEGPCYSCRGTGKQSRKQIARNHTYNRYKVSNVLRADVRERDPGYVDPGELAEDRWNEQYGDR